MTRERIVRGSFEIPKFLDPMSGYVELRITQLGDGTIQVKQEKISGLSHSRCTATFSAKGEMSMAYERDKLFTALDQDFNKLRDQYRILPLCNDMLALGNVSDADARKLSLRIDMALKDCRAKVSGIMERSDSCWRIAR